MLEHDYCLLTVKYILYSIKKSRQGQYWYIIKHRFCAAGNFIKVRCSNTVFYVYVRKYPKIDNKFLELH